MTASSAGRIPGPIRRVAAFTLVAVGVYVILVAAGSLFLPSTAPGSVYSISATVAAGVAAMYLIYLGGLARLRDLLR